MATIYDRYLKKFAAADLKTQMIFVGGPRQVGKTTFALSFLSTPSENHPAYLNWDDVHARPTLMRGEQPAISLNPRLRSDDPFFPSFPRRRESRQLKKITVTCILEIVRKPEPSARLLK